MSFHTYPEAIFTKMRDIAFQLIPFGGRNKREMLIHSSVIPTRLETQRRGKIVLATRLIRKLAIRRSIVHERLFQSVAQMVLRRWECGVQDGASVEGVLRSFPFRNGGLFLGQLELVFLAEVGVELLEYGSVETVRGFLAFMVERWDQWGVHFGRGWDLLLGFF